MFLQRLLQLVTGMIRAQRHGHGPLPHRPGRHAVAHLDEAQHRHDPLLNLIAAIHINLIRTANRIADVLLKGIERFIEFAQQKSFFRRLRVQEHDSIYVTVGHAENVIGMMHEVRGQHPAALIGNINAQFANGFDGVGAGRLAIHRAESGGHHAKISVALNRVPKDSLGHRTPANVPRANKKDGLH